MGRGNEVIKRLGGAEGAPGKSIEDEVNGGGRLTFADRTSGRCLLENRVGGIVLISSALGGNSGNIDREAWDGDDKATASGTRQSPADAGDIDCGRGCQRLE